MVKLSAVSLPGLIVMLVLVIPPVGAASPEVPTAEVVDDTERTEAVLSLWAYQRQEFNSLVSLPSADIARFQRLLRAATKQQRKAVEALLALNCALPDGHQSVAPLQQYRCGHLSYRKFERWATSTEQNVYFLAFATLPDRSTAIALLQRRLKALNALPTDNVEAKEFLTELVSYLEAGGLPEGRSQIY